jgi:hypothetical protein
MVVSLRLYNGVVYVPTSYRVEGNRFLFQDIPLEAVPVEHTDSLRRAILVAIERGNPPISFEKYKSELDSKDDPLLKAAGARSWGVFDRQTKGLLSLEEEEDGGYRIQVSRQMEPRGWRDDPGKGVHFPAGTLVDEVIARLIAMIQERSRE